MKLWKNKYNLDKQIEDFTVGKDYLLDQRLVKYDCIASIAHARMLCKIGILEKEEAKKIIRQLNKIIRLSEKGRFRISKNQEDCHTAIENYLARKLGKTGKKIHTARSRNDQIIAALRLYYKKELNDCKKSVNGLINAIKKFIGKYREVQLPGYTHTRKAMPSSVGLWGDAFIDSMEDNLKLVDISLEMIDQSPLGAGAGYGIPLDIDREYAAKASGFSRVQKNPIYAQNSRGKFESTILHALSQIMLDINKIASDLIVFSMPEFGYFELPKEFCTGSSIMPQKKNPDVLELLRAEYNVVVSCEFQVKSIISSLLSAYNRDLQLTKWPTLKGIEVTNKSLPIMALVFENLAVNKENCSKAMTKDIYATEEVYNLVKKGIPFRDAYKTVSKKH